MVEKKRIMTYRDHDCFLKHYIFVWFLSKDVVMNYKELFFIGTPKNI